MVVSDIIKSAAEKTLGIQSFGYGAKAYSDIESRELDLTFFERIATENNKLEFPRLWLYPIVITEEILKSGALDTSYNIDLLLAKQSDFTGSGKSVDDILNEMHLLSREYILRLKKEPGVLRMTQITKRPAFHITKQNLVGYMINFKLNISEAILYPCN